MYSFLEIEFIFRNCTNCEELEEVCKVFLYVISDGDLTKDQRKFLYEKSKERYLQIINL